MIKYKKGDLVVLSQEGKYDVVLHGINCHCYMSDGIALQLANIFPAIKKADLQTVAKDKGKMGTFQAIAVSCNVRQFLILNCYTQFNYAGYDIEEPDLFNYEAFEKILKNIAQQYCNKKIGMPLIGSGHAGGNMDKIISIIEKTLNKCNVDIIIYSNNIPKQYYSFFNKIKCLIQ